jgi:hypothetical protein
MTTASFGAPTTIFPILAPLWRNFETGPSRNTRTPALRRGKFTRATVRVAGGTSRGVVSTKFSTRDHACVHTCTHGQLCVYTLCTYWLLYRQYMYTYLGTSSYSCIVLECTQLYFKIVHYHSRLLNLNLVPGMHGPCMDLGRANSGVLYLWLYQICKI